MTDTPIIDEAVRQVCNLQELGYTDVRVLVADALRAALPWEPPAEATQAMAETIFDKVSNDEKERWQEYGLSLHEFYLDAALRAYRAQPIMRELYPEKL